MDSVQTFWIPADVLSFLEVRDHFQNDLRIPYNLLNFRIFQDWLKNIFRRSEAHWKTVNDQTLRGSDIHGSHQWSQYRQIRIYFSENSHILTVMPNVSFTPWLFSPIKICDDIEDRGDARREQVCHGYTTQCFTKSTTSIECGKIGLALCVEMPVTRGRSGCRRTFATFGKRKHRLHLHQRTIFLVILKYLNS